VRQTERVPHDPWLADRIRAALADEASVSEKKMFGGVAFLVDGKLAVAASGQGGLLVRVDPGRADELVGATPARRAVMRGREMDGWLRVDDGAVSTRRGLDHWVRLGCDAARAAARQSS